VKATNAQKTQTRKSGVTAVTGAPASQPECPSTIKVDGDTGCPMVLLLETIAGRWSFPILYRLILQERPIRFGELKRMIGAITQKELTKRLRLFELLGLVTRTVYAEVPPRVEYQITDYGASLRTPLAALAQWSVHQGAPLYEARRKAKRGRRTSRSAD
jgi:DNA-binding HxlR family transcriptional regulator